MRVTIVPIRPLISLLSIIFASSMSWGESSSRLPQSAIGLSPNGFSGIGLTPSARSTPVGVASFGFQNSLPGLTDRTGYNFLTSIGLLPGIEVNGRLATRDLQCNLFVSDCGKPPGIRDLSVGLKASLDLVERVDGTLSAAIGVTDFGGAATNFRSHFAVGSWMTDNWEVSAGWIDPVSSSAFGSGPFASVTWTAPKALQLNAEWVDRDLFAAARLWLPERLSPRRLSVYADIRQRMGRAEQAMADTSYGVGLSLAMDSLPRPRFERSSKEEVVAQDVDDLDALDSASSVDGDAHQAWAISVVGALEREGLEDVALGQRAADPLVWVVRFENAGYLHNDLDALAIAATRMSQVRGGGSRFVILRLMRRGVETIELAGEVRCLRMFFAKGSARCQGSQISLRSAPRRWRDDVAWLVEGRRRSSLVPRLYVVPALESRVGTEYGAWDASLAANVAVHVPLWRGALLEGTQIYPVGNTEDFERGRIFSPYRFTQKGSYRVMIHQALGFPYGLSARAAVGVVGKQLEGGVAELRFEPFNGRHKIGLEVSHFGIRDAGLVGNYEIRSALASYRLFSRSLQASFELKAGRFINGDEGFLILSRHWIGDVAITPYYRKSRRSERYFPDRPLLRQVERELPPRAFAGIEFSFPLTPRKGFYNRWLRVNGNDRFFYSIESVVNNPSNDLLREYGQFPPVPLSLDGTVFNFDRASDIYLESNLSRLPFLSRRLTGP